MTNETKTAPEAIASTAVPTVKKAAVKKAVKKAAAPRAGHVFTLTAKAAKEDFGSGQRAAVAKAIKNGSTRTALITKFPDMPPANISWYLSMMVRDGFAKKTAAK